ncbi:penicillin-binding protein 1A [Lentimicrobium sp. S6]|uniref:penicillin-binding protein 1A n=1 Tax=Lentimicrobium sp. S6 TaxID=2735872 RepID=UPI001556EE2C|nr:transglycosylase domain-containing protein [Lentimicrobium sp. S6]NPD44911.1 penicillin-binding protein [Lentimicrobium sp. S6]
MSEQLEPHSIIEEKKDKKYPYRKWIIIFWSLFITAFGLGFLMFVLISQGKLGVMPTFEELENPFISQASVIYSEDGEELGSYFIENRKDVDFRDLSPNVVNALVATEDIRFYEHSGIDFKALVRVVIGVLSGNHKGGGSTITQQLAKQLYTKISARDNSKRVLEKFNEWVIAVKLEKSYSKDEIMAMYLNKYDFLNNADGIYSASKVYFSSTPDSLSLTEAATLVGMLKNSSLYNPLRRPELVTSRRNVVLSQMKKYGYIDQMAYDTAIIQPLGLEYRKLGHSEGSATYLREYLRKYLKRWCAEHDKPNGEPYNLYQDGLRIYTTIDSRMQNYAEESVQEHLGLDLQPAFYRHWNGYTNAPFVFDRANAQDEIDKLLFTAMKRSERYRLMKNRGVTMDSIELAFKTPISMRLFSWEGDIDTVLTPMDSIRYYKSILQSGLMSMEPKSGKVKAYVGGLDYTYFKYDHVTQARRQVGSTFKPFVYTLAMQEGNMSPCSKMANVQPIIPLPDGSSWIPRNSNKKFEGKEVTLKWALANSINWISAQLIDKYNPSAVVKMARNMGITSPIPAVHAIALGTPDISLYEMVGGMSTFANKGVHLRPYFITHIEDKNGNVLEVFGPDANEAMSEETAYLMISLMKGVVESGTGVRLRYKYNFHNPIAGKTGTTQNQSDGWFMGLTPDLVTGVWVGCEDRSAHFRTITLGQGANMALPIWALYMRKVYEDPELHVSQGDFEKPSKPLAVEIDCEKFDRNLRKEEFEMDDDF